MTRFALLLLLAGCYRDNDPNLPPVQPDYPPGPLFGADAGACPKACARLHDLGCPEGFYDCEPACAGAVRLRPLPLDCWADAGDQLAARSCGGLRCK